MARVIPFYIPDTFKPKSKYPLSGEGGRVIEFPGPEPEKYIHPTWIFPEVDGDLSAREG
jgi:hypothetical protein